MFWGQNGVRRLGTEATGMKGVRVVGSLTAATHPEVSYADY